MWQILEEEIERKARRILAKHRRDQSTAKKHAKRFTTRTGVASSPPQTKWPLYWSYDSHFDPIYCISHARFIAKRIWSHIQSETYKPKPAILFDIPKPNGGTREIMVFTIPDSALANVMHRRLTHRNRGIFSGYSFAYRPDKTIFEAVIQLQRMMQPAKTFALQYDYSKYFDTIDHEYLRKQIQDGPFVVTKAERYAITKFLEHRYLPYVSWQTQKWETRKRGVPQGSSLSLFLSNVAAHELDMELERLNGSFVRFADDAIAVAHSYADARNIEIEFRRHCLKAGVQINFEKSSGITLLNGRQSDDERQFFVDGSDGSPLEKIKEVDFLGHCIAADHIDLTKKAVKRIKRKISQVIYIHLLQYARQSPPMPIKFTRVGSGFVDWDLVTCLNEIRRYIYGGLSERELLAFIDEDRKLRVVRGLLAFYPLVSRASTLKMLDGWLKNIILRAIRERNKLLLSQGLTPYKIDESALIDGSWHSSDVNNETSLPSFVLGWRAARKYYKRFGLSDIQSPSYYSILSLYT